MARPTVGHRYFYPAGHGYFRRYSLSLEPNTVNPLSPMVFVLNRIRDLIVTRLYAPVMEMSTGKINISSLPTHRRKAFRKTQI